MKPHTWKVVGAVAVATLVAAGVQASADADADFRAPVAAGGTRSALALPFPAETETVFHPVDPTRILDTRSSLGGHLGKISASDPFTLHVAGGVVPNNASSIAFNVTVTGPTANSWLTIYPAGGVKPTTSNINYLAGQTVANFSVVRLGAPGWMSIAPGAGSTHVIVDVFGYYSRSTAWGTNGFIGWVEASDVGIGSSHVNNGQAITFANNGTGSNTITFVNAGVPAFIVASASIQVSTVGVDNVLCGTGAVSSNGDLRITVTCEDTDANPVNALFYLQVAG